MFRRKIYIVVMILGGLAHEPYLGNGHKQNRPHQVNDVDGKTKNKTKRTPLSYEVFCGIHCLTMVCVVGIFNISNDIIVLMVAFLISNLV